MPFNALAEGFIVESFRRVGLPMARIRPAIEVLRDEIGLENALLSEKLQTDGAEILYRNGENELVVVRNHQGVFNEVVAEFLHSISYRDGQHRAGEPMDEVAEDFGLERRELRSLILQTA